MDQSKKKYINFENKTNSCWLDAAMIVIANTKTFKKLSADFPESQINKIIQKYEQALTIINNQSEIQQVKRSRAVLRSVQKNTMNYLQEYLKFKNGEPESAFFAILTLIHHDRSNVKKNNISWVWLKECCKCNDSWKSNLMNKPVITLPKVKTFDPRRPTSLYTCTCKKVQEMKLDYKELSDCLIFHFESGAGKGKNLTLNFKVNSREYHLTSVIMFECSNGRNKDHFITWIRRPFSEKWLKCNDMNKAIVYFHKVKPELKLKDIYMCVYETFDDLGKTNNELFSEEQMESDCSMDVIELSDDDDWKTKSNIRSHTRKRQAYKTDCIDEKKDFQTDEHLNDCDIEKSNSLHPVIKSEHNIKKDNSLCDSPTVCDDLAKGPEKTGIKEECDPQPDTSNENLRSR